MSPRIRRKGATNFPMPQTKATSTGRFAAKALRVGMLLFLGRSMTNSLEGKAGWFRKWLRRSRKSRLCWESMIGDLVACNHGSQQPSKYVAGEVTL